MSTDPLAVCGVTRSSILLARGWSRHRIAREVEAGRLLRPRRGWVARPNADPALIAAAGHGLLLSCITQAARLGLWALDARAPHLAVRHAGAEIRPARAILHWRAPIVPRAPHALEDPIENVLDHVAHCQPREEAIAVWDSALNQGLVDRAILSRLPFKGLSKQVLAGASPFADSGLESYVRQRLVWLRVRIVHQAWILGHRVDFLIGERLILQIDGASHTGAQRTNDIRHDAELALRGYTVIRIGYGQVMLRWPEVQDRIMMAIAQRLHLSG